MFGLGLWEILMILLVVLILFGNRIPKVARSVGKAIHDFKQGVSGSDDPEDK